MDLLKIKEKSKGVYHFKINANRFQIHYKVTNIKEGYYPHLGVTAREGLVLLYKHPQKELWASIEAYHNSNLGYVNMSHMLSDNISYEVLLYTPLLSDLEELIIETDDEHHIEYIDDNDNPQILVCGGSTSFGMGCTTVSLMFSNILARKLVANITNVSFDDKDYIRRLRECRITDSHNKYAVGIIELNEIDFDEKSSTYLKELINDLNSCCDITIGWYYLEEATAVCEEVLKEEVNNASIILKDVSHILNDENRDMCSYGNGYINDSGNILIFKELFSTICEVTKWNI
ncbi:MAG: hypothetical protein BZ137_09235 [Methanosphaera sp. rholeuAM130]|nr:MAG: hypothetical protein BZ137_09235 [Methanosphaera sp. rholeuAM130]